ncbi:hypothetical protein JTE90_026420 [Oedothorax gibbosus]|uniref:DUF4371 domain-containing protein n=1 Tax=Oedothorax gibbosus TaxID=931172 RepID=A0AAV6TRK0_9ARAC|nr:hypothetical protein JTE90_026420 [Oedothorax gibbosus]
MMERTKSAQQSSQSLISSFFGHQPKKPRTDSGVPVTADFTETTQDAVHTEKASTSSLAPDTSLTPIVRGHRDDGPICLESPVSSEGNFKALLRFRVDAGDKVLEKHLNTASSRSTYVSKTIQNQIINCCKEEITEVILSRVSQAGLYSIIFDETTDSSNKAQVSLVLRYVRFGKEVQIREDFITFVDAFAEMMSADIMDVDNDSLNCDQDNYSIQERLSDNNELSISGENLGQIILRKLTELNLPLTQCVGIGTDGCSDV